MMKDKHLKTRSSSERGCQSQLKGSNFLHFFNRTLIGRKILLFHSPSHTWFFGLVLLETRNILEVLGWQVFKNHVLTQTSTLSSQLKECLKKLHQIPIPAFLNGLPCNEKGILSKKNTTRLVPIECQQFISSNVKLSCKKFPKETITIFWQAAQEMPKQPTKLAKLSDIDEIFIKIEGKKLIGRPWERLVKEPRKRW